MGSALKKLRKNLKPDNVEMARLKVDMERRIKAAREATLARQAEPPEPDPELPQSA